MRKRGPKSKLIDPSTKSKMVTIRLPGVLYNALAQYSKDIDTSMNEICIDQLYANQSIAHYIGLTDEENNVSQSKESTTTETKIQNDPGNSTT